jgi:single-stranded-DNA-specific exonuclease
MDKQWIIKDKGSEEQVKKLVSELNIDVVLANILVQRQVKDFDQARMFFRPDLADLHDPFLMKDMDKAVSRIQKAIHANENIMIYGDYDVDGTTSVALVYSFLKGRFSTISYYIPNRYTEGYGVSKKAIDYASEAGISLIIALDCGIKAIDKIAYARSLNIDFIVCDHHLPGDSLPEAVAILDPKRADCEYPYKELSGCGVGFKLIQAFCQEGSLDTSELYALLDLVAVSIASDIVPITGENRILAFYGLKRLNEDPCPGLKSIINIAGLQGKKLVVDDIVYKIGPRINAAGRMESGSKAVELLLTGDDSAASEMGGKINVFNDRRKNIDRDITQQALKMIASDKNLINSRATVLFNPDWHKGVIGIVASRLIESYYRPTVVLTESNGFATGSARSVPGFDLYQAMENCSDLLENFGGHMYAAGMTMKIENVPDFRKRFIEAVSSTITEDLLIPRIEIDSEIRLEAVNSKFFRILAQFQPFGPGNTAPVFLARNVIDSGSVKIVGPNRDHLKLDIMTEENLRLRLPAIAFGQAEHYKLIHAGMPFDICFSVEENVFQGKSNIQLNVRDIKIREEFD